MLKCSSWSGKAGQEGGLRFSGSLDPICKFLQQALGGNYSDIMEKETLSI